MEYEKKQGIIMFPNKNAGKPMTRKDGSEVINPNSGEVINQCDFNGTITLPDGLPAGEYEVNVYRNISRAGNEYMSGKIKKAWVKPEKTKAPDSSVDDDYVDF
jgi:hypothetical protein